MQKIIITKITKKTIWNENPELIIYKIEFISMTRNSNQTEFEKGITLTIWFATVDVGVDVPLCFFGWIFFTTKATHRTLFFLLLLFFWVSLVLSQLQKKTEDAKKQEKQSKTQTERKRKRRRRGNKTPSDKRVTHSFLWLFIFSIYNMG